MQSVSRNSLIATFHLLSAASLNLGWSQNGVLGKGLKAFLLGGLLRTSCLRVGAKILLLLGA